LPRKLLKANDAGGPTPGNLPLFILPQDYPHCIQQALLCKAIESPRNIKACPRFAPDLSNPQNLSLIQLPSILLSTACLHISTSNMARNRAANDDSKNDNTNGKEKGGNGNGKGRKVTAATKPDPKAEAAVPAGDSSTSQTGNPNVSLPISYQ